MQNGKDVLKRWRVDNHIFNDKKKENEIFLLLETINYGRLNLSHLYVQKGQLKMKEVNMKLNNLNYLINYYSNLHNLCNKSIKSEINNDLILFLKSRISFQNGDQ